MRYLTIKSAFAVITSTLDVLTPFYSLIIQYNNCRIL